jgi:hypothetical protein
MALVSRFGVCCLGVGVLAGALVLASFSGKADGGCGPATPPPPTPAPTPPPPLPPTPPEPKATTVEEMIQRLVEIKAKKDALAREEQEVIAALKKKTQEQHELLRKLGITLEELPPTPAVYPSPPAPGDTVPPRPSLTPAPAQPIVPLTSR